MARKSVKVGVVGREENFIGSAAAFIDKKQRKNVLRRMSFLTSD